jgi:hypothetical protein
MSGTDPGLFGVPAAGSRDDAAGLSDEDDAGENARSILDARVDRMPVHAVEAAESAGMNAAAYQGAAHRPPARQEHPTLPDATILVNVTEPLGIVLPVTADSAATQTRQPAPSRRVEPALDPRSAPTDPSGARLEVAGLSHHSKRLTLLALVALTAALVLVVVAFLRQKTPREEASPPTPSATPLVAPSLVHSTSTASPVASSEPLPTAASVAPPPSSATPKQHPSGPASAASSGSGTIKKPVVNPVASTSAPLGSLPFIPIE